MWNINAYGRGEVGIAYAEYTACLEPTELQTWLQVHGYNYISTLYGMYNERKFLGVMLFMV